MACRYIHSVRMEREQRDKQAYCLDRTVLALLRRDVGSKKQRRKEVRMETTKAIQTRRSVRSYKPGMTVEQSVLEEILQAAQLAPSWKNSQTARYYVVHTPDKMKQVIETGLPEFNQKNCVNCCAIIVTTFVKNRAGFDREGNPDNELGNEWGAYDLGLASENLILKAQDLGLDSLIMGIRDEKALRQELSIPEDQEVVSVISLGYGTEQPEMPKRKELEKVATFF